MKHFLLFIVTIFLGLFLSLYIKNSRDLHRDSRPVLRVYASSSFIKQWGPGPWLKEKFESTCDCRVEYSDAADSTLLMQRLKSESNALGADLVLGFDQYDLEMVQKSFEWRPINIDGVDFEANAKATLGRSNLVPYDWGVVSFIVRQSDLKKLPSSFEDLLDPELSQQITLQDPRTSSLGLQFLLWLIQAKGEESAFSYLQNLNTQVKAYGANWSTAYGLFQKGQVKATLSYTTSAVYHLLEEKTRDIVAVEFKEAHPVQYEYLGIPANCKNCELAQKFTGLIFSKEGQKVIMEKNYMFPVVEKAKEGTVFETLPKYKILNSSAIPTVLERERILKKWTQLRKSE